MRTHQEIDQRSLALHRLVATKIRSDPALLDKAGEILRRWRETVCVNTQPYLEEWRRLMEQGPDACLAVAVEESEHAAALRQSSPLSCLLTNQERFRFLKEWNRNHDHAPR
jgi:hypothetical protein